MCGLAGMAGKDILSPELKVFRDLLYVTALRGEDSTGLYAVDHATNAYRMKKTNQDSSYFIWDDSRDRAPILKDIKKSVFIGHCRYATKGSVNQANAHPFDVGRLVGAHNGTLLDDRFLVSKEKTDSELMFTEMAEKGVLPVLESLDKHSAFAVSIYDKNSRKVILARNKERPLFIAVDQKQDVVFWASEEEFLQLVAKRHNRTFEIRRLVEGTYYEIDVDSIKRGHMTPYSSTEMKLSEETVRRFRGGYDSAYYDSLWGDNEAADYGPKGEYSYGGYEWYQNKRGEWKKRKILEEVEKVSEKKVTDSLWEEGTEWDCSVCALRTKAEPTQMWVSDDGEARSYCCDSCSEWVEYVCPDTHSLTVKSQYPA